ncbi:MAG TPA: hypothetical protein VFK37_09295, partial [Bacillales bacterium]|nr:hypothetical protein [Bacillales bacterium]
NSELHTLWPFMSLLHANGIPSLKHTTGQEGFFMISLRGDGHKLYLKLKRKVGCSESVEEMKEMAEMTEMEQFYRSLKIEILEKIRLRMIKEKNGNGIIPVLVTSLPWLAFIFSKELRDLLSRNAHFLFWFLIVYTALISFGTIIHYREKAWAAVHLEMINGIIKDKKK